MNKFESSIYNSDFAKKCRETSEAMDELGISGKLIKALGGRNRYGHLKNDARYRLVNGVAIEIDQKGNNENKN